MEDIGFEKDNRERIAEHQRRMAVDNAGHRWENWPHKVDAKQDGGGTWTMTCQTCGITWRSDPKNRDGYHGD